MSTYPTKNDKELIKALSELKGEKEVAAFLRDLLSVSEIEEFSKRFQVAKLLWTTKLSYIEIAKLVGTSTTTVTRAAHWLYKESWRGFATILMKMYGESK